MSLPVLTVIFGEHLARFQCNKEHERARIYMMILRISWYRVQCLDVT
jgi:hypothetical protein